MEIYLQYRRIGNAFGMQLRDDVQDARDLKCVSRQQTRVVGGRPVVVVEWDGEDDPLNPRNWSSGRKFRATVIIGLIAFLVAAIAPIDASVLPQAARDFGVSNVVESLDQAVFLIGFGTGALVFGPFSEVLGRNFSYIVPLALFCVWTMASALAPNIGAQVAFRFLAGFCGATPLVCAGGSLSDMYTPMEKTYNFPFFAIFGFGGPAMGPVMSAWIPESPYLHTWRWSEWVALLLSGVVFTITFFLMPETHAPTLLSWKAKQMRKISGDNRYYALHEIDQVSLTHRLTVALPRPFVMAFYEPVIVLITLYLSMLYIILFTFFEGYTFIFQQTYGISQELTNTILVGIPVGVLLGALPVPWIYKKTKQAQATAEAAGRKQFDPEIRLWNAMLGGAIAIPISLLWMGWTAYPNVSIWSPICASVLFGYGVVSIFISSYMYLIDVYEAFAASSLTLATLVRYVCAGGMTVVGIPFYKNMGVHWTLTILACLSALLTPIPYVFYRYGHLLRRKSKFARTREDPGLAKATLRLSRFTTSDEAAAKMEREARETRVPGFPSGFSSSSSSSTIGDDRRMPEEEQQEDGGA